VDLTSPYRDEIAHITRLYSEPRRADATITNDFFDPIHRPDRIGEVCMVVQRQSGGILLAIKTFYPSGAYRLPTGGIAHGESILDALRRETEEETGLETEILRFLAQIAYRPRSRPESEPIFHTFAFLLAETGGTLAARDDEEQIEEYIEVAPSELRAVADRLERLPSAPSNRIGGDWSDWGKFRAVVHAIVADALGV
jgi:8-oxo-dGTP pyrophosphatase MutT (NUDIX family)